MTGSKPLFVFDLDSTITKCELLPMIAESIGLENEMTALTEASMHGNNPFEQNFRKRVGLLECVSVSQARSIAAKQPLYEKIAGFIRANSQQCMILTGNLDVWIEPILEDIGMKESCVCSRPSFAMTMFRKSLTSLTKEKFAKDYSGPLSQQAMEAMTSVC